MVATRITSLLGSKYPFLSGGMGSGVASPKLVAAIAEAGSFPFLGSASTSLEDIRNSISETQALTNKPFGVNVLLIPGSYPDATVEEVVDAVLAAGVKVVETAGRSPKDVVPVLKAAGVTIVHKAARVRDAASAERAGADAVSILAYESGGHISAQYVGHLVQLQAATAQIKIPIVAAGGIATGRGVLAALALGAEGVLFGTRFAATQESPLHPETKAALVRAGITDTVIIAGGSGDDVRVLSTELSRRIFDQEKNEHLDYKQVKQQLGTDKGAALYRGEVDKGTFPIGQAVGLIEDIPTVAEVIDRLVAELGESQKRLLTLLSRNPKAA